MRVTGHQCGLGCTKFEQQNFLCPALSPPTDLNVLPPLHGSSWCLHLERCKATVDRAASCCAGLLFVPGMGPWRKDLPVCYPACSSSSGHCASVPTSLQGQGRDSRQPNTAGTVSPFISSQSQRPSAALAIGGALARPAWLSSPTLGRANRFLSTAAVSLMTPRRPLSALDKIKVLTLRVEQRTREDSEYCCCVLHGPAGPWHCGIFQLPRGMQSPYCQHCSFPFPGHADKRHLCHPECDTGDVVTLCV